MGLLDRVKEIFSRDEGAEEPPELPLDIAARQAQLAELEEALRALARAMAAAEGRMPNPGWRGRVEDLRFAANEAGRLSRQGFDRADLHDLAAQVRPLYNPGLVPPEYEPYTVEHDRVLVAVAGLRAELTSERGQSAEE